MYISISYSPPFLRFARASARHGIQNVTSLIEHSIELHVPFVLLALSRKNSWNAPRCQRKQCSPKQLGRMNRTESERFRFYLDSRDMNKRAIEAADNCRR